jgi:uncharacterized OsmC-like protein
VSASVAPHGEITLESDGLSRLQSEAPVEFDGPGTLWSPETLLTAAVADCLALTFRGVAKARHLPFLSFQCEVEGTLDRVAGRTVFTEFRIHARLRVPEGTPPADAERALVRAKDTCLVTNSLTATTVFQFDVVAEREAVASHAR